ncbi:hypothetical protein ACJJTC_008177 [Scirpophaga incertulas]
MRSDISEIIIAKVLTHGPHAGTTSLQAFTNTCNECKMCCPNGIKGENFMVCSRCPDRYHYTCLNLTKHDFVNFTKEFKDTWVCPSCRSKEPKRGDNSNTPVRCTAPAPTTLSKAVNSADHNDNANVTLRSKTRTTSTAIVAASSKSCSCMTPEILREIIREELDKKLDTVLSDQGRRRRSQSNY